MSRLQAIKGFTISRDAYFVVAAVALASLALIVLTGAAVRLTASGLGCPDWPKCYGGNRPAREPQCRHRVRQSSVHRVRRDDGDRRLRARLPPPALPLAPRAVRRAAAARCDRPGGARRPRRRVSPRAGPGHGSLHPLDAAARRRLRADVVLAVRAGRAPPLERPARRLVGPRADPVRTADDPRRHDQHRLGSASRRSQRRARPALRLQGDRDPAVGGRAPLDHGRDLRDRRRVGLVRPRPRGRRPPRAAPARL